MHQQKTAEKAETRMKSSPARLGREIQNKIGQQLRSMYDDVVKEGVPEKFRDMLRQIDNPEDSSNEGSRG